MAKLEVEISAIDKLSANVANMNNKVSGFVDNIQKKFDVLSKGFVALGAATGVAYGIKRMIDGASRLAESVESVALKTNLSTKAVQQWDYALSQNKSSMEAAQKGFREIQVKAFDAERGLKDARDAFAMVGVSVRDANGNMKQNSTLSKEVIMGLAGIEDVTTRTALAQKLLGKAGGELLPLLAQGQAGTKKLLDESERYGQVLDSKTIKSITAANDAIDRFTRSADVMKARIVNLISGPVRMWADGMMDIIASIENLKKKVVGESELDVLDKYFTDERISKINSWTGSMFEMHKVTTETAKKIAGLTGKIELYENSIKGKTSKEFVDGSMKVQDYIDKIKKMKEEVAGLIPKTVTPPGMSEKLPDNFYTLGVDKAIQGSKVYQGFIKDNMFLAQQQGDILARFSVDNLEISPEVAEANKKFYTDTQDEIERAVLYSKKSYGEMELEYVDYKYSALIEKARAAGIETIAIEKMVAAEKDAINQRSISASLSYTTNNMRTIAAQWNQFIGAYKTIAIAQATWDTYSSAVSAYKATVGIPVVGPVIAPIASGTAIAAGLANVAQIAKMNPRNMASGGVTPGAGIYRVGEHGPETIPLPGGARVYNAMQTKNMNTSNTMHATFNFVTSGGRVIDQITTELRRGDADRLVNLIIDKMAARV